MRSIPLNMLALQPLKIEARLRTIRAQTAGPAFVDSGFAFVDELGDPISPTRSPMHSGEHLRPLRTQAVGITGCMICVTHRRR
ncbi:MAG: hypothetical protein GIW98_03325 [Candidatus Eremiobacteraeota bacterium]|nr:hypothetical protein [Candidatus Eremiobacteraeota bacterium]